jgi:hypothetical protein
MATLDALVTQRLAELGISSRAAAARSRDRVSYETVRKIASGKHSGRISDQTAAGLALALDVPLGRIYEAASAPRPVSRWAWPERFDRLPLTQRAMVEDLASALLDAYEHGVRDGRASTSTVGDV